jgi:hypothetical protein
VLCDLITIVWRVCVGCTCCAGACSNARQLWNLCMVLNLTGYLPTGYTTAFALHGCALGAVCSALVRHWCGTALKGIHGNDMPCSLVTKMHNGLGLKC